MRDVMKHLAYDRYIKDWTYVGGKWAGLGHFEFKSLDGTDSGRMLEGDRVFVSKSLVKELGITQRLWMEDGAVEYGPREIVLARVYNPDDVDDLQYLGWVNDEDYWLKEIVGVGERLRPGRSSTTSTRSTRRPGSSPGGC